MNHLGAIEIIFQEKLTETSWRRRKNLPREKYYSVKYSTFSPKAYLIFDLGSIHYPLNGEVIHERIGIIDYDTAEQGKNLKHVTLTPWEQC